MEEDKEVNYMDIDEYKDYLIYEDGRVFGKKRGRFLKPYLAKDGYIRMTLCKDNKAKAFTQHRLIALHFIPNPGNKSCVDHINGIKTDNRIENLRWASFVENGYNSQLAIAFARKKREELYGEFCRHE